MRRAVSQGTLSGVSAAAAAAALADRAHTEKQKALNREARAFTRQAFESAGYRVLPSEANFVMVDLRRPASGVQAMCRESGVIIARAFPPLTNHARISIGTMEEMRRAVEIMLPKLAAPASAVNMAPAVTWDGECC
jgi:histidinol-phosphate aminotransferase